jgi:hypothetical protein
MEGGAEEEVSKKATAICWGGFWLLKTEDILPLYVTKR